MATLNRVHYRLRCEVESRSYNDAIDLARTHTQPLHQRSENTYTQSIERYILKCLELCLKNRRDDSPSKRRVASDTY